jgi:hypothetical protein
MPSDRVGGGLSLVSLQPSTLSNQVKAEKGRWARRTLSATLKTFGHHLIVTER